MSSPGREAVKPWTLSRLLFTCAACAVLWAIVAAICLGIGSTELGWSRDVIQYRWASVAVASIVGAALGAAGVGYQAVLRNPLADPYLLGVSSGASLFVYLAALSRLPAALGQTSASLLGSVIALLATLTLSQRRGRLQPVTLLLVGVIVNAICGSAYLLVYHLNLHNESTFSMGGPFHFLVGGINTGVQVYQIWTVVITVVIGWIILASLSGQLNVATLSEGEAESLGIHIHRLRWMVMLVASAITAAAVAISGPIGFVGLICPHLARLVVGTDQRKVLPLATALGACVLALADAASRGMTKATSGLLPVGVLTGMLGGPFFLVLLWRRRKD